MSGSKISDDRQEYQYTLPFVTPSGHEFSFYDTPENERLIVKHTSGSHIEFKSDGSVFIKAIKDIHTDSGVLSEQGTESSSELSTHKTATDYALEVGGRLKIRCSELDFEIGSSGRIIAGTDLIMSSNNMINKATESISIEGTKSVYMDTKELRKRVVSERSETGTKESGGSGGGMSIMNVNGNAVIRNDDPDGGITIASKGFLNLICGQERVDLVGKYTTTPSGEAQSTFTTKVFKPSQISKVAVSRPGGDYFFSSSDSATYIYADDKATGKYGHITTVGDGDAGYFVEKGEFTMDVKLDINIRTDEDLIASANKDVGIFADESLVLAGKKNSVANIGGSFTVNVENILTMRAKNRIFLN